MATDNPTPLNIEVLEALAGRLTDHAEELATEVMFDRAVIDLKLASRACSRFASFRFRISEIASDASTLNGTRHNLLDALEEAARGQ
jgi:hypothetical protein